jgi:hypothetical protein
MKKLLYSCRSPSSLFFQPSRFLFQSATSIQQQEHHAGCHFDSTPVITSPNGAIKQQNWSVNIEPFLPPRVDLTLQLSARIRSIHEITQVMGVGWGSWENFWRLCSS